MKKTSTSRRKKLPLLLGALLIISVAAYGTRAYFSDSADQQADIKLVLGTVKISAKDAENWIYTPLTEGVNLDEEYAKNTKLVGTSNGVITNGSTITNVRPGDSFVRIFTFENTGSLDVKVNLKSDILKEDGPYVTNIVDLKNESLLEAGHEKKYKVTITVDPNKINNDYNNKENSTDFTSTAVNYINRKLTVEAVQTNAKISTPVE